MDKNRYFFKNRNSADIKCDYAVVDKETTVLQDVFVSWHWEATFSQLFVQLFTSNSWRRKGKVTYGRNLLISTNNCNHHA